MKIAVAAILMCAVMVLVAGAPLVVADTHHVLKGAQGPRASARSWEYAPTESGVWNGHVENSGLRSLVVDVNDITSGAASSILHQRIRFAVAGNSMDTAGAIMAKDHTYNITVTPNGPKGTSCTVDDVYTVVRPPVAMFTYEVNGATVDVNGSASYDPNVGGTITDWGWEWGDGTIGTGMTASHTYNMTKIYTITLTVLSSTGMIGSTNQDVPISVVDKLPVPMFTYTTSGWTVGVDASASTDDHGINSYDWNWGDSTTGTGKIATHTYAASGTYSITLTVTDTATQSASLTKDVIVVDNPPVAMFTMSATSLAVSFDASASTDDVGIVSYVWDFGDSMTGTGKIISHTYAAQGTYSVKLTVTDTVGQTGMLTKDIVVVDNPPMAMFTAIPTSWTVSVDASASTDDVGIVSYAWDFGDSKTGTGKTATHTYTASATYNIKLTVTDTIGQTGALTKAVLVVDNPPVASFTASVAGATASVDASASTDDVGSVSYAWDFGDSTTGTGKTTTHVYTATGTYNIKLTVTDTVGQTNALTKPVNIVLDTPPVASFTASSTSWTVSVDASASTDDVGIVSYDWNWGDSTTGTGKTATHTYAASNTYNIKLTVTDTVGQTNALTKPIVVVDNKPVASFTSIVTLRTVSVDASASTDDVGIVTYAWDFGDSTTGTGKTATHTYAAPGTYNTKLTVTDTVGQTGSLTKAVLIADLPPVASFTTSSTSWTVSVDASASTDDVGITGYDWNWGDGAAHGSGVTASHKYVASNTYSITLTVTDTKSQTGVLTKAVLIADNKPVASFTASSTSWTVSVDASASTDDYGIVSYAWNFGDSTTGTGKTATHTYTASNTYTITLTVTDTVGQNGMLAKPVAVVDSPPVASFTFSVTLRTVSVDASASTDDYGIVTYAWDFGDSTTGTGKTATNTYAAPGTYNTKLTVTDTRGQTGVLTKAVLIADLPPVASFTASSTSWTVSVDASASTDDVGIAGYDWNWGDGSAHGSSVTASHKYAASNTYSITLTVTDTKSQTGVLTKAVLIVDNPPVASFTQTNSSLTVNVVSTSTDDYGIVSYDWNWGDGSAHGSSATATHTYAAPTSLASVSGQSIINVPGFPQYVVGTTYNSAGLALPNCQVTITDQRTGGMITGIVSDDTGFYAYDINDPFAPIPGGWAIGDVLVVSATNANGASGSSTGLIDNTPVSYIDVTLTGILPVLVTVTITLTVTDTVGQTSTVSMTITLKK